MAKLVVRKRVYSLPEVTSVLEFGKYKGMTVQEVIDIDPQYLLWAHDNKIAIIPSSILDYADEACDVGRWDVSRYDSWRYDE